MPKKTFYELFFRRQIEKNEENSLPQVRSGLEYPEIKTETEKCKHSQDFAVDHF